MAYTDTLAGMAGTIASTLLYAALAVGGSIGAYFIYRFYQFKYEAHIYTKRAEGQSALVIDRGGFFKLAGDAWIFRLRKNRLAKIQPPANKFIWRVGKKNVIHLRNLGENQYIPFNPSFNEAKEEEYLQTVNYDENLSWYLSVVDLIRARFDWKTFMEKYGQYIVIFGLLVLVIVVVYLTYDFVGQQFGRAEGIAKAITQFLAQNEPVSTAP